MEQKENENKRNTVLLTVIGIATLLVAIVGATFAYFTAKTTSSGEATGKVTTANIGGATVTFTGDASKFELLDYPGGLGVYGSTASIAKTKSDDDKNNYKATYDLQINYTNGTGTNLDWELYVVDNLISDELNAQDTTICQLKEDKASGTTKYWYADGTGVSESQNNDTCTGTKIIEKITNTLNGKKLASGKLVAGKSNTTITKDTKEEDQVQLDPQEGDNLANRTLKTSGTSKKYYYLIVKYPNNKSLDQSGTDAGKNITVTLSINEDSVQSAVVA